MLHKIGVTGGIGSGKSYVCHIFETMGYPVFYSDKEAKDLINHNSKVKEKIIQLLGEESYNEQGYNRKFVASKVFSNRQLLQKLNKIVHPAVREAFDLWCKEQISDIVFNEAALLFESGSFVNFDHIILVYADLETRLKRLKKRDGSAEEEILKRMNAQWSDERKMQLTKLQINNSEGEMLLPQIAEILRVIKKS